MEKIQTRRTDRGGQKKKNGRPSKDEKELKAERGWGLGTGARLQEGKEAHGRKAFASRSPASEGTAASLTGVVITFGMRV